MRRVARAIVAFGVANVALYSGSCSSNGNGGGGTPDAGPPTDDVLFEGAPEPTDEALTQMLAATATTDTVRGGVFDSPTDGAKLPATPIPTFSWHTGAAPTDSGVDSSDGALGRSEIRNVRALEGSPFGPLRKAFAHGTPTNGKAYFLVFSTATNPKLLRVFTTKTSYVPSADAWSKLTSAKVPITVSLETAIFDNDALAIDGGPWRGGSITLTVGG